MNVWNNYTRRHSEVVTSCHLYKKNHCESDHYKCTLIQLYSHGDSNTINSITVLGMIFQNGKQLSEVLNQIKRQSYLNIYGSFAPS